MIEHTQQHTQDQGSMDAKKETRTECDPHLQVGQGAFLWNLEYNKSKTKIQIH